MTLTSTLISTSELRMACTVLGFGFETGWGLQESEQLGLHALVCSP